MAIKPCKECGNPVSDKAEACPKCGVKNNKHLPKWIVWLVFIILFVVLFKACQSRSSLNPSELEKSNLKVKKVKYDADLMVKAKRQIKEMAKDEDSVQFKNITSNKTEKFGEVVCGQFNAKNSFNAYTGYIRFISNGKTIFIEGQRDSTLPFAEMWVGACF